MALRRSGDLPAHAAEELDGIQMTGMPAFGKTHDDKKIWAIVAFTRARTSDNWHVRPCVGSYPAAARLVIFLPCAVTPRHLTSSCASAGGCRRFASLVMRRRLRYGEYSP